MAATVPTKQADTSRNVESWSGGAATADNDIILEIDARGLEEFTVASTAGAFDVFASVDGTTFIAGAVGIYNATTGVIAALSTAGTVFTFNGTFNKLRFMQNGATAVADFALTAKRAIKG